MGCKKIRTVIASGANGADPGDDSGAGFAQGKGDSAGSAGEAFGIAGKRVPKIRIAGYKIQCCILYPAIKNKRKKVN